MMFWLMNLLLFVAAVTAVFLGYYLIFGHRERVTARLSEIQKMKGEWEETEGEDELAKPLGERLVKPFILKIGEVIGNLAPKEIRSNIEQKITHAGAPFYFGFSTFVFMQVVLALVLLNLPLFLFSLFPFQERNGMVPVSIILGLLGLVLPWIYLSGKAARRQEELQKTLPDILDLLLVSVEAGLGFDMALKRVVERAEGPLSQEFRRALEEIRMGKTREEALRGIVQRTGVPDLSSVISAIIQAEQLGTNIASTLRVQASAMRQKRRQRAEQKAMKAPIKMLFPIVFFIFPVLFVVILGPALIQIYQAFMDML